MHLAGFLPESGQIEVTLRAGQWESLWLQKELRTALLDTGLLVLRALADQGHGRAS